MVGQKRLSSNIKDKTLASRAKNSKKQRAVWNHHGGRYGLDSAARRITHQSATSFTELIHEVKARMSPNKSTFEECKLEYANLKAQCRTLSLKRSKHRDETFNSPTTIGLRDLISSVRGPALTAAEVFFTELCEKNNTLTKSIRSSEEKLGLGSKRIEEIKIELVLSKEELEKEKGRSKMELKAENARPRPKFEKVSIVPSFYAVSLMG